MHFPDLTPYSYWARQGQPLPGVLSIGWLGRGQPFTTGDPPTGFLDKLELLIRRDTVMQTRGYCACVCCGVRGPAFTTLDTSLTPKRRSGSLGSAEVWVRGLDCVYAAPDMIAHYVAAHAYLPPSVFTDAVMAFDPASSWTAAEAAKSRFSWLN